MATPAAYRQCGLIFCVSRWATNMPNSKPPQNPPDSGRDHRQTPGSAISGRVAHAILEAFLRARLRWQGQRSDQMNLSLSPDCLAAQIMSPPVVIAQALAELTRYGAIVLRAGAIFVTDPDQLVDAAGADPANVLSRLR